MLSSEEQMQILKEALLQGYKGPIFELIDEANVEAYQKQAQAAQQQSQETPSVGTPALGGEFEAKAPQSSTERNIIQPGQYKSGGIKKYTDGGVKLSMGAEANHNCGPGIKKCGDTEGPVTLQRYTGLNYNTGNKNVGMDLDLGTQFSFGKDDTRSGAPVLQTGLSGNASMNIESFKNSNIDAAFDSGLDAYAKVGYKRKTNYGSADWDKPIPGFELGAYGNYDLLNKNIKDVGVYGKYGAFTGNVGYNPQTKGGMLGIGLKFKEGGVRRHANGGPDSEHTADSDPNAVKYGTPEYETAYYSGDGKGGNLLYPSGDSDIAGIKMLPEVQITGEKVSDWDKFEKSKFGKFIDARGAKKMYDDIVPGRIMPHFGYGKDQTKDFALDAAAIVNPIPDFIHAGTKFNEGKTAEGIAYAGLGILPFSAGPLVNGAKAGYNRFKSTLRNAWHTNPNPSSLIESMKLSDDVISQGTKDIKRFVTDNPNKLPVKQINENHITAVGDVGGLGPYMKPTDRHLVSVNIDGNTTVPMYRSTSFGGKPLVNESGEVISSKGFYSPYLGSADVSGQMFNKEGINQGWQVKQAGWDQGYGSDYLRGLGFHLKDLDIQDTHKAMQNLTINEDAINPVAYNWDELTDWTKRKGGVRKVLDKNFYNNAANQNIQRSDRTGPHSIYNQKNIEIKLEDKPILNIEGVKKGIADAESLGGKLMLNPESTATGLYGQRFSELKGTNVYKGTREEFAKDLKAQNKVFELRLNKGMNGTKGLLRDSEEIYNEYAPQIKNFQYSKEDLIALTNFLGRQGVREYLGYHVRDQKPLDQALPKLYGKGAKQANKTPEEYLKIVRKHYQKGGVRKYRIKKHNKGGLGDFIKNAAIMAGEETALHRISPYIGSTATAALGVGSGAINLLKGNFNLQDTIANNSNKNPTEIKQNVDKMYKGVYGQGFYGSGKKMGGVKKRSIKKCKYGGCL